MLSGLGPKDHLEELGIKVKLDLPGVGKNLMDHTETNMIFEFDPKKIIWTWQATALQQIYDGLSPEQQDQVDPEILDTINKYSDPASSPTSSIGAPLILDWFSDPDDPSNNPLDPDTHVHFWKVFFFDFNLNFEIPNGDNLHKLQISRDTWLPNPENPYNQANGIPGLKAKYISKMTDIFDPKVFLTFLAENLKISKSNGSVKLRNKDPRSEPLIDLALFEDDEGIERLAKILLQVRRVMHSPTMLQYSKNPDDYSSFELYPGTTIVPENIPFEKQVERFKKYIKAWQSFGHHASGTAKMGKNNDRYAVVDSKLKVRGVDKLRVVDLSIYPTPELHSYNPSRGAYLIAEVASDIIKADNL